MRVLPSRIYFVLVLPLLTYCIQFSKLSEGVDEYHIIESKKKDDRNLKFFSFHLEKLQSDANLVVQVYSGDPKSDPDIFIFKNASQDPSNLEKANAICEIVGGEACVLQEEDHIENNTYHITVACTGSCSFSIRVDYISTQYYDLGPILQSEREISQTFKLNTTNSTMRVVRIHMPRESQFDRINLEFIARFENVWVEDSVSALHSYLNKANKVPSPSEYDKKGKSMWEEIGEIISVSKNPTIFAEKDLFCLDCNYTISLLTDPVYSIEMEIYTGLKNKSFPFDNTIRDIVETNDVNTYFTLLSQQGFSNQTELWVEVLVYTGKLTLYINSDIMPENLHDSDYSSDIDESETFIMTNEELIKKNFIGKKLYISVEGRKESAVFSLILSYSELSNYINLATSNNWRSGEVMSKETILYYLNIDSYNSDKTVKIDMVRKAPGIEVYLKKCCVKELYYDTMNCMISEDEMKGAFSGEYEIKRLGNKEVLHETYFIQNETPLNSSCYYTIGLFGNSSQDSKFRFVVSTEEERRLIELFERQVHRSHVSSTKEFFKFHLMSDEDVHSVSFIVNAEIGSVKIWVSRRTIYPNSSNYERYSEIHSSQIDFEKSLELSLQGTYYISVETKGNTYYSITSIVGRNHELFNNKRVFTIKLTEGFLERIEYTGNDRLFFFEFNTGGSAIMDFETLFEDYEVYLWIEKFAGSYSILVSGNGNCPNEKSYNFKFEDDFIRIKKWENNGHYCVLVLPNGDEESLKTQKHSFTIQYLTPRGVRLIAPGTVVESSVGPKASENFKFSLNAERDSELIINLKDVKGARFILTVTPDLGDGLKGKEYLLTEEVFVVNITKEAMQSKCEYAWLQCFFFASIKPEHTDTRKVAFSIVLREIQEIPLPIRVYDGKLFSYPNLKSRMFFYADIDNKLPSIVQFHSQETYFDIYITIKPSTANKTEMVKELMSGQNIENTIRLFGHSTSTFTFKPWENTEYHDCVKSGNCMMGIMVERSSLIYSAESSLFSIYFTNKVSELTPGISLRSFVEEQALEYFKFTVRESGVKRIKIDATILDGEAPDIYVSHNEKARPTEYDHDWSSLGGMHEENQLIINKTNSNSFEGTYVIGILGKTNCSFLLSVTFGEEIDFRKISRGKPETVVHDQTHEIYLQFFLRQALPLRILIVPSAGKPLVEVASNIEAGSEQRQIDSFSSSRTKWFNKNHSNIIFINSDDLGYCFNCSYLIRSYCQDFCVYDIYVVSSADVIMIKDRHSINDFVQGGKSNIYMYDFRHSDSDSFKIDVINHSGQVNIDVKEMLRNINETTTNVYKRSYKIGNSIHLEYDSINPDQKQILFITVNSTSSKNCEYQLVLRSGEGSHIRLRQGIMEYSTLKQMESIDFLYIPRDENDFSITIKDNDVQDKYSKTQHYFNVEVKLQKEEYEEETQGKILKIFFLNGVYLYRIAGSLGKPYYKNTSQINGDEPEVHQFGVMANQGTFALLSAGNPLIEIVPTQKTSFYELVSSQSSVGHQLLVELFECTGRVVFLSSDSYESLLNTSLRSDPAPFRESKYLASKFKVPKERTAFYFSVKPIEGGQEDANKNKEFKKEENFGEDDGEGEEKGEAVFLLKAKIFPSDARLPFDKFIPGNDGKIEWTINPNGDFDISFSRLKCLESKCRLLYSPQYFSYTLYVSTDEPDLDSQARCSIPYYNKKAPTTKSKNWNILVEPADQWLKTQKDKFLYTLKKKELEELMHEGSAEYFINVVGEVEILEKEDIRYSQAYKFPYSRDKILLNNKSETVLEKISLFLIVFVVFLLLALLWFYRRYTLIQKKLKYEMQDIRNVANLIRFSETKAVEATEVFEDSKLLKVS